MVLNGAKKRNTAKRSAGDDAAEKEYVERTARRITGSTNGWSMRQQLNAVRRMKKAAVGHYIAPAPPLSRLCPEEHTSPRCTCAISGSEYRIDGLTYPSREF